MNYKQFVAAAMLIFIFSKGSPAGEIKIGLYYGHQVESVVFSVVAGEYVLYGNGKQIATIKKGTIFHIEMNGSKMDVHDTGNAYGSFTSLSFGETGASGIFQVKPVFPPSPAKESDGRLDINFQNGSITFINTIDLEKYIAGTVESEGGSAALPEYYKAQAVIARTYAVKNFSRHAHQGFNLCDDVHCQAYKGKSRMNKEIYTATLQTENQILSDVTGLPVVTAYHSNCGGITGSAAIEWNRDVDYLVPVNDPFCDKSSNRNWSRIIPITVWQDYLTKNGITGNSPAFTVIEAGRQKYLDPETRILRTNQIREDLKLKSSWFHIEYGAGNVTIKGHGYGHGLGLCQLGAMEMARCGYNYVDILMFYFKGLTIQKL